MNPFRNTVSAFCSSRILMSFYFVLQSYVCLQTLPPFPEETPKIHALGLTVMLCSFLCAWFVLSTNSRWFIFLAVPVQLFTALHMHHHIKRLALILEKGHLEKITLYGALLVALFLVANPQNWKLFHQTKSEAQKPLLFQKGFPF